jgi:hypothetical protein
MQISAAIFMLRSTISRAVMGVFSISAVAAARAKLPPEPMVAIRPSADGVWLDHVAIAGEQEHLLGVGDDEQGLELAEELVGAPVLGELDGGAAEVAAVLLELGLEAGEEREGVGGGARKAGEDLVVIEAADFLGGVLHDGRAEGDLSVGGHHHAVAAANAQDGGGAHAAPVREVQRMGG